MRYMEWCAEDTLNNIVLIASEESLFLEKMLAEGL